MVHCGPHGAPRVQVGHRVSTERQRNTVWDAKSANGFSRCPIGAEALVLYIPGPTTPECVEGCMLAMTPP